MESSIFLVNKELSPHLEGIINYKTINTMLLFSLVLIQT